LPSSWDDGCTFKQKEVPQAELAGPGLPAPTHRAKKGDGAPHGDALRTCTTASLGKGLASVCRVPPAICPPDPVAPVAGSNHSTESVPDVAFKSTASALPLDVYPRYSPFEPLACARPYPLENNFPCGVMTPRSMRFANALV